MVLPVWVRVRGPGVDGNGPQGGTASSQAAGGLAALGSVLVFNQDFRSIYV
jgi:hypothetical protein